MAVIPAPIEKLRDLKGPDREVDAEIMFDLFAVPTGKKGDGGPIGYLWPEDNPSWSFGIRFPGKDREWFDAVRKGSGGETLLIERDGALVLMNSLRIPTLTASLDAVTALIERDGYQWLREHQDSMTAYRPWGRRFSASGANNSIALLIAYLELTEVEK